MDVEITLSDIFKILVKYVRLITIIPAAAVVIVSFYSYNIATPIYEADAKLYIINERDSNSNLMYSDLQVGAALVKDYAEIAKSRSVIQSVGTMLGIEISQEDVDKIIEIKSLNDTRMMQIVVKDPNPVNAAVLARALTSEFMLRVVEVMQVDNVTVLDPAAVPQKPTYPKHFNTIVLAGLLSLVVAVGLAFMIEFADTSLKTADDVDEYLGVPLLARLPELKKKGQANGPRAAQGKRSSKVKKENNKSVPQGAPKSYENRTLKGEVRGDDKLGVKSNTVSNSANMGDNTK